MSYAPPRPALTLRAEAIDLCDRVLGERARREHRLRWLDAGPPTVQAYYPAHRLVVEVDDGLPGTARRSRALAAHGLRHLVLDRDIAARASEPDALARMRRVLGDARVAPAPFRQAARGDGSRPRQRSSVSRAWELQVAALALALLAAGGLLLVVFDGGAQAGLGAGGALLAFGLAIELYARTVGAVSAAAAGERAWAVASAIVGSPMVALHALTRRSGPLHCEGSPLVALIVLIAIFTFFCTLAAPAIGG